MLENGGFLSRVVALLRADWGIKLPVTPAHPSASQRLGSVSILAPLSLVHEKTVDGQAV